MESETKTLFVGNLPYEITEPDLEVEFAPYGLHWIRLVRDRGIAFIDIDADRMQEAIDDKHDSELWGRRLTVNESQPRDDSSPRPQPSGGDREFRPRQNDDRPPFRGGPDRRECPPRTERPIRPDGPGGWDGPRRHGPPGHPKDFGRPENNDRSRFPRRRD